MIVTDTKAQRTWLQTAIWWLLHLGQAKNQVVLQGGKTRDDNDDDDDAIRFSEDIRRRFRQQLPAGAVSFAVSCVLHGGSYFNLPPAKVAKDQKLNDKDNDNHENENENGYQDGDVAKLLLLRFHDFAIVAQQGGKS
ncbi:hypothetical protein ACLKA7_013582 [Drosophila subpalustris]